MAEWKDVTSYFSESQRYYKDTYLEIDEVYNEELEVSLFSSEEGPYEIYFSYGKMYGIVYADADKAYEVREQMKKDLQEAYDQSTEPSSEYIDWFAGKYDVQLPLDIYFDFDPTSFF